MVVSVDCVRQHGMASCIWCIRWRRLWACATIDYVDYEFRTGIIAFLCCLSQVDGQSHVVHSEEEAMGTRLTIDSLTCLLASEVRRSAVCRAERIRRGRFSFVARRCQPLDSLAEHRDNAGMALRWSACTEALSS